MKMICTLLAAAGIAVLAAAPASSVTPRLVGTVGPGFTISLKKNGKAVKTLKAGTYTLVVSDKSSIHDFQVEEKGRGLDRAITTVPFTGTKTVTLTLKRGKLKFYCAPHESSMFGFVTVT